eukprot:2769305-Prymnesium_polylepis.1
MRPLRQKHGDATANANAASRGRLRHARNAAIANIAAISAAVATAVAAAVTRCQHALDRRHARHGAGAQRPQPAQHAQQRRLARAARAGEQQRAAAPHAKRDGPKQRARRLRAGQCDLDSLALQQQRRRLHQLRRESRAAAATGQAGGAFECGAVASGSLGCGGGGLKRVDVVHCTDERGDTARVARQLGGLRAGVDDLREAEHERDGERRALGDEEDELGRRAVAVDAAADRDGNRQVVDQRARIVVGEEDGVEAELPHDQQPPQRHQLPQRARKRRRLQRGAAAEADTLGAREVVDVRPTEASLRRLHTRDNAGNRRGDEARAEEREEEEGVDQRGPPHARDLPRLVRVPEHSKHRLG